MNLNKCRGTRNVAKASFSRRSSIAFVEQFVQARAICCSAAQAVKPGVGQVVKRLAGPRQRADQVLLVQPGPLVEIAVLRGPAAAPTRWAAAASRPCPDA